jgi:hypothetical protein
MLLFLLSLALLKTRRGIHGMLEIVVGPSETIYKRNSVYSLLGKSDFEGAGKYAVDDCHQTENVFFREDPPQWLILGR